MIVSLKWDRKWDQKPIDPDLMCNSNVLMKSLAERVGFEPTLPLPVNRISSAAHSTTLPPLREVCRARVRRVVGAAGDRERAR